MALAAAFGDGCCGNGVDYDNEPQPLVMAFRHGPLAMAFGHSSLAIALGHGPLAMALGHDPLAMALCRGA